MVRTGLPRTRYKKNLFFKKKKTPSHWLGGVVALAPQNEDDMKGLHIILTYFQPF